MDDAQIAGERWRRVPAFPRPAAARTYATALRRRDTPPARRELQSGAEQRWAAAKASVPLLAAVAAFFAGVANKLREIKMDYYDFW